MSNLINHTPEQIEKIGNSLIYLIDNLGHGALSKKSLLKLVYILEEQSIEKNCIPFFNLQYEVWKFGPVAKDVHTELYDDLNIFKSFIEKSINEDIGIQICSKTKFVDDEFSDSDLQILNDVKERFQNYKEKDLIEYTHREGSLWYNAALENGVLDALLREEEITTPINIDFTKLLQDNKSDLDFYNSHLDFLKFCSSIQ